MIMSDTNQNAKVQKLARGLKFEENKIRSYCLSSEQQK